MADVRAVVHRSQTESRSGRRRATSGLFLPHILGSTLEGRPIEDVIFLRDEMANMAWAVERIVESAIERPRNRFEEEPRTAPPPEASPSPGHRQLSAGVTTPPGNWVPLLPVQTADGLRLKRGKVLKPDGSQRARRGVGPRPQPDRQCDGPDDLRGRDPARRRARDAELPARPLAGRQHAPVDRPAQAHRSRRRIKRAAFDRVVPPADQPPP